MAFLHLFQFFTNAFAFASDKLLRIQKYVLYDYVLASDDFWPIAVTREKCKQCKRLKKSFELSTLKIHLCGTYTNLHGRTAMSTLKAWTATDFVQGSGKD